MTEREFLRRVYLSSPDAREVYLNDRTIEVAKEAGATFDPEPVEPVVIFEESDDTSADRLLLKPGGKRETFGFDFDGWETAHQGTYRWERRHGIGGTWSEWKWQGNNRLMAELARRLLAEHHAPKGATVQRITAAYAETEGCEAERFPNLRAILRAAGLPEGEP